MKVIIRSILLAVCTASLAPATPVTTHPRLLIRADDLPELRSRMVPTNDVWMAFKTQIVDKALLHWKCASTSEYRLVNGYYDWVRTSYTDETGVLHQETDANWLDPVGQWSNILSRPAVPEDDVGDGAGNVRMFSEQYAMVFALMARLLKDQPGYEIQRAEYLAAAKDCLFTVLDHAYLGEAQDTPWRQPYFGVHSRSFANEAFPLAVDWIYEDLTPVELAKIRKTFLIWAEQCNAHVYFAPTRENGQHRPANTPALLRLDDPDEAARHKEIRLSLNNHWANHLRQMILYGLALDPGDDIPVTAGHPANGIVEDDAPSGAVTSQVVGSGGPDDWVPIDTGVLRDTTGVWLYLTDYAYRNDGAGGPSMEGSEYASNGLGPVALAMAALQSAGQDDPLVWGPQVSLVNHPLWTKQIPTYLSLLPPASRIATLISYMGPIFQPPIYGDIENFALVNDQYIKVLGPMAIADAQAHGTTGPIAQAVRYIQRNLAPGGASQIATRISNAAAGKALRDAIYYFLVFDPVDSSDPAAPPAPTDPRPSLQPLTFYAAHTVKGRKMGFIFSRTGQTETDTYFHFRADWNRIDHQRGDSLSFGLWKNGLWLTKVMTGYGTLQGCSDYRNALSLQNGTPGPGQDVVGEGITAAHGSQWHYSPSGDPDIVAHSFGDGFLAITVDATPLYNHYHYTNLQEIEHASRSIVWLKPNHIVVYDRARSKQTGFYKRFYLNLPDTQANTTVTGNVIRSTAKEGTIPKAELFVTALLPAGVVPQITDISSGMPAWGEDMQCRMLTDAPGAPKDARFLHVLQGTNAGVSTPDATQTVTSADGSFEGAVVGNVCVLFRKDFATATQSLTVSVPISVTKFYVTGLAPSTGYDVTLAAGLLTVTQGAQRYSDGGGVLVIGGTEPASIEVATTVDAGGEQGGTPVKFTFARSGNVSAPLAVSLAYSGAATAADFATLPGSVTFAASQQTATLTLTPVDDAIYEGSEDIVLTITAGANYHASEASASASATIVDNDSPTGGTLQFTASAFTATENSGAAAITVSRMGSTSGLVAVRVSTSNGTATAGADYATTSQIVQWADGEGSTKIVNIPLLDDPAYEGDETVSLVLSQVTGQAAIGVPATAVLTIDENDPAPPGQLALSPTTLTIAENTVNVVFTVTRSGGDGGAVAVNYATMNGSASAGTDFVAASGTLTWADGESGAKTVIISLLDDTLYEGNGETFTFALSDATGAPIFGSAAATVTLTENDPAPADFHVGPGQPYSTPADVPWPVVGAGSTVYIHHRAAPYTNKILITNRGTADDPIRVIGVPGPSGERPVIDGDGATAPSNVLYPAYTNIEDESLIAITRDNAKASSFKPGYIEIKGLEISGAHPDFHYSRQSDGVADAYSSQGGGIYVSGADHVTIRDCIIHHCAQGLVTSAGGNSEEGLVRELVIDTCHFHDNGKAGQFWGCNVVTQGVGITLRHSRLDPPLSGTNVENVRDRSASFTAHANWFEGGGSQLNLESPSGSAPLITSDTAFGATWVTGNIFRSFSANSANIIHVGDSIVLAGHHLELTFNTFHVQNGYSRTIVNLHTSADTVVAVNNVVRALSLTELRLADGPGKVGATWGKNLASPAYVANGATVNGPILTAASSPFVDEAIGDYHPSGNSPLIDVSEPLPGSAIPPSSQFVAPFGAVTRAMDGATLDIGAIEANADESAYAVWRYFHFGDDLIAGTPGADPDQDGVTNLIEFQQGMNPTHFDPGFLPTPTPTPVVAPTPAPAIPTVIILNKKKLTISEAKLKVRGTTTGEVTTVIYRVDKKSKWKPAKGIAVWVFTAKKLKLGRNKITVLAIGNSGISAPAKVTVRRK